jgi:hypothetical protein
MCSRLKAILDGTIVGAIEEQTQRVEVQRLYDPDFSVDQQLQTYSYTAVRKPVGL